MIWSALLIPLALALPSVHPGALLGPDGPLWVGPLPPPLEGAPCGEEGRRCEAGPVVVVDPQTGSLWFEERDPSARGLQWHGTGWHFQGAPLEEGYAGAGELRLEWSADREGQMHLDSLEGEDGVRRRYFYDEDNRLSGALWADGSSVAVRYDEAGRVLALDGPGRARWRLDWRTDLAVTDTLGNVLTFRWKVDAGDGSRALAVEDALGRTAWTWYRPEGEDLVVSAWEDPRGLRTTVRGVDRSLRVEDGAGRAWSVLRDEQGRVIEVLLPSGGAWRWHRDAAGRVVEITDPAGRVTRWERDASGAVEAVVTGGQPTLYPRDADGRVSAIQDPIGATTQLRRDLSGRIVALADPAGGEITLSRGRSKLPLGVLERDGSRWTFGLTALGRPSSVVNPVGQTLVLERDSAGRPSRLRDPLSGEVRLRWTAGGRLARVESGGSQGLITGLLRDAVGRLVGVRRSDGLNLSLSRDQGGDVVDLVAGDQRVHVRRDPTGLPLAVGAVAWDRDGGGRVSVLRAPGLAVRIARDAAGRLRGLDADGWALAITRDAAGRPVRWISTDGERGVSRDSGGRVVAETGATPIRYERDSRGWVSAATVNGRRWRWSRDGVGRILEASGPHDLELGVDWDGLGRPVLVRYPGGDLARRSWEGGSLRERLEDTGGKLLLERTTRLDTRGNPSRDPQPCTGSWVAEGREGDSERYRWTSPEGCEAPGDQAQPIAAWGVGTDAVVLSRDGLGRIAAVSGEAGERSLRYDALGRLSAILGSDDTGWQLRYDPRGSLAAVVLPSGREVPLVWASASGIWTRLTGDRRRPGRLAPPVLLANGQAQERVWVTGPDGLAGAAEQDWTGAILALAQGSPRHVLLDTREPQEIHTSASGFPDSAAGGLAGADGAFQPFAGGPLFAATDENAWKGPGTLALDPVSGGRVDGAQPWPWAEATELSPLDPELWQPESPWSQPLRVLTALGELPAIDDGPWTEPEEGERALSWLPAGLDRGPPPLGPSPNALPLREDPVTLAFLRAALPGGEPVDALGPVRALLASEIPLPWLPPGLTIPGLW